MSELALGIGSETKSQILVSALNLFSGRGYENVSMREIADEVGIKAASIYNHYLGKEDILSACYDFYLEHRYDTRLTPDQYEPILKNGSMEDVIAALNYPFNPDLIVYIYQSFLIVFSRVFTDKRAKEIYASEIKNSLQYLNEFFERGIQIGRMDNFNVPAVATICLGSRLFSAHEVTLSPEDLQIWRVTEVDVFKEFVKIVPFKY